MANPRTGLEAHLLDVKTHSTKKVRFRWILSVFVATLLFPLPLRHVDTELMITQAAWQLLHVAPVRQNLSHGSLTGWTVAPFNDSQAISDRDATWHVVTDTQLDMSGIEELGFARMSLEESNKARVNMDFYDTNAILEITVREQDDKDGLPRLRFNYYYGWLGAQGYRIRAYRCLLGTWLGFELEWVS